MLPRNKAFLFKEESTKGADSVPTPADNLIVLYEDSDIAPATEADMAEGELKGSMGPGMPETMKQSCGLPVTVRVRGLGQGVAAQLLPELDPFLKNTGHTVVSAGDGSSTPRSATYSLSSTESDFKTASGYWFEAGLRYRMLAATNGFSIEASMAAPVLFKTTIQSAYEAPTVVAVPAITPHPERIFKMTSALVNITEAGGTVNIGQFSFDTGSAPEENFETGNHDFSIFDRSPTITIDPKAVTTAVDWDRLTNSTAVVIVATFTNAVGETLILNAPKCVPVEQSTASRGGRMTRSRKYQLVETTQNDQYTLVWTSVL